jgi:beta-glucosidase
MGHRCAAWQIERDVQPTNWTLFEHKTKGDGKTPCCPQYLNACDAIAWFDTDLKFMEGMNMASYRFELSWSALNPADGTFDRDYLLHYVDIARRLRALGIEPLVTIWHFELPAWLEERGGICSPDFLTKFELFVGWTVDGLKSECQWWFTLNEPAVSAMMDYLTGVFPPGHRSLSEYKKSFVALMRAHVIAYHIIHEKIPGHATRPCQSSLSVGSEGSAGREVCCAPGRGEDSLSRGTHRK